MSVRKSAMDTLAYGFNSPSHGICVDRNCNRVVSSIHWSTKLFNVPRIDLGFALFSTNGRCNKSRRRAHHLHRVSRAEVFDFPLPTVGSVNRRWKMCVQTYNSPSLLKILGGTTTELFRLSMNIEVRFGGQVRYHVDPWSHSSVLEDRRGPIC